MERSGLVTYHKCYETPGFINRIPLATFWGSITWQAIPVIQKLTKWALQTAGRLHIQSLRLTLICNNKGTIFRIEFWVTSLTCTEPRKICLSLKYCWISKRPRGICQGIFLRMPTFQGVKDGNTKRGKKAVLKFQHKILAMINNHPTFRKTPTQAGNQRVFDCLKGGWNLKMFYP